jgi:hypothetical protein
MKSTARPEKAVVNLWLREIEKHRNWATTDGEPLDVLYPGRPNDGRGGDFRDAVIFYGEEVKRGSIEIHSLNSGWEDHGHHRDPQYNQVVLHVVWQQDNENKVCLENGESVPTIALNKNPSASVKSWQGLPCRHLSSARLGAALDRLGDARLSEKVRRFHSDLPVMGDRQAFYAGLLEALGYTKNKRPCLELARLVPFSFLESLLKENRRISIQACLLGSAGLLPSQRGISLPGDGYQQDLERAWQDLGPLPAMCASQWEMYKVRPGNFPVRRLVALSQLVSRFGRLGWLETWRRVLVGATRRGGGTDLTAPLKVKAEGYWRSYYDFGLPQSAAGGWLLGRERAAEIVINIIFPFFIALSQQQGESAEAAVWHELYDSYPPGGTNSIQKQLIGQFKPEKHLINSARRQQGLLQLYRTCCTQGGCPDCSLNQI